MFADKNVPEDEKHFEDVLHERYGHDATIGLMTLIAIPFLVVILLGFEHYIASGFRPEDQGFVVIGFLLPMAVMAMVPALGIFLLIDHLWERKIKRAKDRKFHERYPYWQPLKQ